MNLFSSQDVKNFSETLCNAIAGGFLSRDFAKIIFKEVIKQAGINVEKNLPPKVGSKP